jgi:hypothetical protein
MKMDPILAKSLLMVGGGLALMTVGIIIETPVLVVEVVRDIARSWVPFAHEE